MAKLPFLGIVLGVGLIAVGLVPGAEVGHTLPEANGFFSMSLSPESDTNKPGTDHRVTATVTDAALGTPEAGVQIAFEVVSGPNAGAELTCSTDPNCFTDDNGQVSATYVGGTGEGLDAIQACTPIVPEPEPACSIATKEWVEPLPDPSPSPDPGPTPTPEPIPIASLPASDDPAALPSTGSEPPAASEIPLSVAAALALGATLLTVASAMRRTFRWSATDDAALDWFEPPGAPR
jgi:hypothetical protein